MATNPLPVFVSDFTKLPEAILIDLINYDNNTSFVPGLLSFGIPHTLVNDVRVRNTSLQVSANPISNLSGSVVVYYNRVDLNVVPGIRSIDFLIPEGVSRVADIIPLINSRFGIRLTIYDIENDFLPTLTDNYAGFSIITDASSLVWVNRLDIRIKRATPGTIDLSTVFTTHDLDVFQYAPPLPDV